MQALDRRRVLSVLAHIPVFPVAAHGMVGEMAGLKWSQNTFRDIATRYIHPGTNIVRTLGYRTPGDMGHATYIHDDLATPELAALAPRFCQVGSDGRIWRAAVTAKGLLPVAAGGAIGNISFKSDGSKNDQPAIAQALLYQQKVGAAGIQFNNGNFTIWCPTRKWHSDDIDADQSGIPFLITGPTVLQSGPGGTSFSRRKFDGSDPSVFAGTQFLPSNVANNGNGIYWRGGMFMLVGPAGARPNYNKLASLHLKGIWSLNGGIPQSTTSAGLYTSGSPAWYTLGPGGSGWDVTDKPIWGQNDRHTGDIVFEGNITMGGFRGELIYQGGDTHGSIYQTGSLILHDTDGDGFCPGPSFSNSGSGFGTVQMQSLTITSAYQALEGATGWNGFINTLSVTDCTGAGGLMSGFWGPQAQPTNRPVPILSLNSVNVTRSGNFRLYRACNVGTLNALDTCVWVGEYDFGTSGVNAQTVNITADRISIDGLIVFAPGPKGAEATHDNYFGTLTLGRTAAAKSKNLYVYNPLNWYGSLGQNNIVNKLTGEAWLHPQTESPLGTMDYAPVVKSNTLKILSPNG